jgi:hypothetical protein
VSKAGKMWVKRTSLRAEYESEWGLGEIWGRRVGRKEDRDVQVLKDNSTTQISAHDPAIHPLCFADRYILLRLRVLFRAFSYLSRLQHTLASDHASASGRTRGRRQEGVCKEEGMGEEGTVHITPCGSFALDVPSLNFRRCVFVASEKVYRRDSEAYTQYTLALYSQTHSRQAWGRSGRTMASKKTGARGVKLSCKTHTRDVRRRARRVGLKWGVPTSAGLHSLARIMTCNQN